MNDNQTFRAKQILGWVNLTLKSLPNNKKQGVTPEEAMYIIHAALYREKDEDVINYCENKFKEWYDYGYDIKTNKEKQMYELLKTIKMTPSYEKAKMEHGAHPNHWTNQIENLTK